MARRFIVVLVAVCFIFSTPRLMWGMPPREGLELPEEVKKAKLEGVIDSPDDPIRDAGKKGVVNLPGYKSISLVSKTKWIPCVLVYFTDQDSTYPLSDFQTELFDTTGAWPTGSCYDYYYEISYGNLELKGNCFGWYSTGQTKNYYAYDSYGFGGPYLQNTAGLAMAAITATDSVVDYSKFDNDGDGYVDCLWVVHSGFGAEETGHLTDIWSHSTRLSNWIGEYTTNDLYPNHPGEYIKIDRYIVMPERSKCSQYENMVSIGVFCHEFGHGLGLPDLYDTDNSSEGIGNWGLMAAGSWGGDGWSAWSPVHMCVWSKVQLGWIEPTVISLDGSYEIPAVEHNPQCYYLYTNGNSSTEHFLLVNRDTLGFDAYIYNPGILIYHIDTTVSTDNDREWYPGYTDYGHYMVALEQADGRYDLEKGANRGDVGDPFPGSSNRRSFTSSDNYDFSPSFVKVENISDPGDTMTCDISVTGPTHDVATLSITSPPDTVLASYTYTPQAVVKNCGTQNVFSFDVVCEIDSLFYTIYTDTIQYPFLAAGYKKMVSFKDWTVPLLGTHSGFNYTTKVTTIYSGDEYPDDDSKLKTIRSTGRLNYANHDIGNVVFTVTCWGSYGFMSPDQNQGSGFTYPKDGTNSLYYGTLMAGNSLDWVVDREKTEDWQPTDDPDGRLTIGGKEYSDQDAWAMFNDSSHPTPKGLTMTQKSWAWADPPYDDFVIVKYTVGNAGTDAINGLYLGPYMDYDIGESSDNWGGVDTDRNLAYMWYNDVTPYVGVSLLEGELSNVTIISNPTYVWPDTGLADTTAFKFLSGELSFQEAENDTDYSVMVSAGPFDLSPGDSVIVAFAFLGGENLTDLQTNADAAQEKYLEVVGVQEPSIPLLSNNFILLPITPNPANNEVSIRYCIPRIADVSLTVYNIAGEVINQIVNKTEEPGLKEIIWKGTDSRGRRVASGVYFCKLDVAGYAQTQKITIIR